MTNVALAPVRTSRRAETELVGVYEISKLLASAKRLEPTLRGVLALLSSFLNMRHGLIALLDSDGEPETVVGLGWSQLGAAASQFRMLPERAIGQIVVTKVPLVIANATRDTQILSGADLSGWGPDDGGPYALIGVPIKDGDAVTGTFIIDCMPNDAGSMRFDEDVRMLTMTANLIGQTLRLYKMIARDRERLMDEQRRLEKELKATKAPKIKRTNGIIGQSQALKSVLNNVHVVAKSKMTVLLRGESGTGKELFANTIHKLSPRQSGPFIKLNCAALPESVLESELFGHEKGAFTGALQQRRGRFELADGGTLFLDEIGEISPAFQAKLLRVLQEGEFERVGGTRTIKVDVRLVCATNKDLEAAVRAGEFRSDLYYRINVVPIFLPPLRERREDVPLLAQEFLNRFNQENSANLTLSDTAVAVLAGCYFPGNIRELENCIQRTAMFAHGDSIVRDDFACCHDNCLSAVLWQGTHERHPKKPGFIPLPVMPSQSPANAAVGVQETAGEEEGADDTRSERDRLIDAMEMAGWVQAKAARLLGLTPRQMGYALRKHNIEIKKF